MRACGIIAEYNPFHNGHAYQLDEIRKHSDADVIVAVMSGNFLQRGEPAIVDKWTRTQMALAGGVDLVVELPAAFASQPADFFARGGVQILNEMGVDYISFGAESGSAEEFLEGARWLVANDEKIGDMVKEHGAPDVPYPQQVAAIVAELDPAFSLEVHSPNNQLGFSYAKEVVKQDKGIQLLPIQRKGAAYHESELDQFSNITSATAIRLALLDEEKNWESVQAFIPKASFAYLAAADQPLMTWESFFPLLKYQLTVQSPEVLENIYQMNEGLENRLKKYIQDAQSFEELMQKVKTKRYTQTRLQRLLTYTLMQWQDADVLESLDKVEAIRVLGFNDRGQKYLGQIKHDLTVPLISNVTQANKEFLAYEIQVGEIYQLGAADFMQKQDFTRMPIKHIDTSDID